MLKRSYQAIVRLYHQMGSAPTYYRYTGLCLPWLAVIASVLLLVGLVDGLYFAPADYQQGDSYRIIFIHVPSAWMSLFVYVSMAISAAIGFIWRMKLAEVIATSAAPIGASFTLLALITGALWGKPMWGTYWVWDARLTSELLLLFLYLGVMALYAAIEDKRLAARSAAILAMVGVVNIPIIHYSVKWWSTLHQGPIFEQIDNPSVDSRMLVPLLVMAVAFKVFFVLVLFMRSRCELLLRERNSQWVKEVLVNESK